MDRGSRQISADRCSNRFRARGAPVACLEERNGPRIRRHSNARFRPVLKLAPQLRVDRSANASVNADGIVKFSIYNFQSGTLVGFVTAKGLTVFQIGLQYLTTMDHRSKDSCED